MEMSLPASKLWDSGHHLFPPKLVPGPGMGKGEEWLPQGQETAEIPTPLAIYTGPATSHTILQNSSRSRQSVSSF